MSVLVTHAGRFGDCLWALPTVRAISEALDEPVDFCISRKYGGITPLLQQQRYIRTAFPDLTWEVQESAPITPAEPLLEHRDGRLEYERTIHLAFRGWPVTPSLAQGYWLNGQAAVPEIGEWDQGVLNRPWITVPAPLETYDLVVGFTDEWFELKFGLSALVHRAVSQTGCVLCAPGSRWHTEGAWTPSSWADAAWWLGGARLFLGCLSASAVLAAALGKPRVLVEPNEQRWHPVFQHWDTELVKGNDGRPTFDARHVIAVVEEKLR